jgi:O-antigen/teichoic acid export membrane protein
MMWARASNRAVLGDDYNDHHFRTDHLKADLGSRTARGGVATITSQGFKFFIGMAATIVLARLLTPQDYGLVGMVAVVTGFVSMFKDMGLAVATIQKEKINAEQISTLFWINVALSVVVMLVTTAVAPGVAWFYGEPRLTMITIGFAAGFLFGGLTVQHEALLRRQMRFTALAVLEITSLVIGLGVAVMLARRGARYWALVINQLIQAITYAAGVWIVCGWIPGPPVRSSGVRSMFAFGGNLTGFHVINYFARNLDNMLIGKFWGSWQLGIYSKAYQLLLLPIDQINSPIAAVAVPALSRLADSPDRYRKAYLRILEKVAILTMPAMAFMIVCSDWIVNLILGPQWIAASRIFAVLGIVGLIQPVANTTGWLFMSQGRARDMFRWGLIGSTIMIVAIIAGLPWGAIGVALTYSSSFLFIVAPLLFWFVGRRGPVRTRDFYSAIAPVASASLCGLAAALLFRASTPSASMFLGMAACFLIISISTFLILVVLPSGRLLLRDAITIISLLTSKPPISGETLNTIA